MGVDETLAKHSEEISALRVEVANLKEDVKVLGSIENAITKITTLMEVQTSSINDIHNEIKDTKKDVTELKDQMNADKINNIKEQVTDGKESKKLMKGQMIYPTIAAIIGGVVVGLILLLLK